MGLPGRPRPEAKAAEALASLIGGVVRRAQELGPGLGGSEVGSGGDLAWELVGGALGPEAGRGTGSYREWEGAPELGVGSSAGPRAVGDWA